MNGPQLSWPVNSGERECVVGSEELTFQTESSTSNNGPRRCCPQAVRSWSFYVNANRSCNDCAFAFEWDFDRHNDDLFMESLKPAVAAAAAAVADGLKWIITNLLRVSCSRLFCILMEWNCDVRTDRTDGCESKENL